MKQKNKNKKKINKASDHSPVNKKLFLLVLGMFVPFVVASIYYAVQKQGNSFNYDLLFNGFVIGVAAQMVDGALGMAFGITSSSFLLATGTSPLIATASVHIAEVFTTGAAALSHWYFGNINRKIFFRLLLGGIIGALVGVYVIVNFDGKVIKPYVSVYLLIMGLYILLRAFRRYRLKIVKSLKEIPVLGFFAAMIDSIGGGGWGAMLNSTMLGQGRDPRTTIGSVNSAEFFITATSGTAFFIIVGLQSYEIVIGLILGGMLVSPFAARLIKTASPKVLFVLAGLLISGLSIFNLIQSLS